MKLGTHAYITTRKLNSRDNADELWCDLSELLATSATVLGGETYGDWISDLP